MKLIPLASLAGALLFATPAHAGDAVLIGIASATAMCSRAIDGHASAVVRSADRHAAPGPATVAAHIPPPPDLHGGQTWSTRLALAY